MMDHSKRLSQPLRWTRAGRVAVGAVALALVAAVGIAIAIATSGGSTQREGCIEVTFASTLGAAVVHECGASARRTCATPASNPALAAHGALREACRRARLPYGSG